MRMTSLSNPNTFTQTRVPAGRTIRAHHPDAATGPRETRGPVGPTLAKGGVTRGRTTRHPSVTSVRSGRGAGGRGLRRGGLLGGALLGSGLLRGGRATLGAALRGRLLGGRLGLVARSLGRGGVGGRGVPGRALLGSLTTRHGGLGRSLAHRGDSLHAVLADGGHELLATVGEVAVGLGQLGDGLLDLRLDLG